MEDPVRADLLLVGAGHAHVQVLRRFMMRPQDGVRLTLVVDRPDAVYSGMVPGLVAGEYDAEALTIDAVPLARRARARVVLSAALRIDARARSVEFADRPPLRWDVASIDVGSTVRGLDLPGVAEHALATRPIRRLVDELPARLEILARERRDAPWRVLLVGAGAAGMELAFALDARIRGLGARPQVQVLSAGETPLPGDGVRLVRLAEREARERGIEVLSAARVERVSADGAHLADGTHVPADLVVWATGAAPLDLLAASDLPCDERGFVRVRPTLQVEGHDDLFAVGDCAALPWAPWVRKAGVYAVREGPRLDHNLRARLSGARLQRYRPQRDFLALLNLGDGRAIAAKWGLAARGRALWRWKDWIDRRFMRRFQVLAGDGSLAPDFPDPESMGMEEMPCGGCAAKLGASDLERALARLDAPTSAAGFDPARIELGLHNPDDAAALRQADGSRLVTSVDAFRAFADDPWLVGRVAAINAASDLWAKGVDPDHALAWVNVPEEGERGEETLFQVLSGVRAALDEAAIPLVGGHTTHGGELMVGLSIAGTAPREQPLLASERARVGDRLILTKPLGTGVLLAADMQGRAPGDQVQAALASMLHSNRAASRLAREHGAHAATDVSGFGLAGHAVEVARASGTCLELSAPALTALPGALALLRAGLRSSFHAQNAALRRACAVDVKLAHDPRAELLFDPQTSGGLLISVPAERAGALRQALCDAGDVHASEVGSVLAARADGVPLVVRA